MHRLLVAAVFALSLPAQVDRLTAHPQDVPHVATGQVVPFGNLTPYCEGRSQLLLRAQHLPGPGAQLVALEFHPLSNGTVTYESLQITVSPVSPSATRWANFDLNLPQPTTVVQLANHAVQWSVNGWHRFPLSAVYVHDGVSNLTIDIKKDAVAGFNHGGCTGLYRPDLETMLATFAPPGSGGHLSSLAQWQTIPIDVRLVWSNAPATRLRSPIPTSNLHGFSLGSTFDHLTVATPGSLFGLIADLQFSLPVTLPFAAGQLWVQGIVLGADFVPASGEAVTPFAIPPQAAFLGQQITFQALVIDAMTSQWQLTNASDCFVGF